MYMLVVYEPYVLDVGYPEDLQLLGENHLFRGIAYPIHSGVVFLELETIPEGFFENYYRYSYVNGVFTYNEPPTPVDEPSRWDNWTPVTPENIKGFLVLKHDNVGYTLTNLVEGRATFDDVVTAIGTSLDIPELDDTNPSNSGVASSGVSDKASRSDHVHAIPTASEVGAIPTSAKGANNGVASLDSAGKIPVSQLPSYVDDVLEFADIVSLPVTGETGKIYVTVDNGNVYRWTGTVYVRINNSVSTSETATKLTTARNISLTGGATGSASFDGSASASITVTVDPSQHTHSNASITVAGLMSATDKAKLDGIATSATNTPLSNSNPSSSGTASAGSSQNAARADHVHPSPSNATTSVAGFMSASDKTKLDGVQTMIKLTGTLGSGGESVIVFPTAFASTPFAIEGATWSGNQRYESYATAISATGVTIKAKQSRATLLLSSGPFEDAPSGTPYSIFVVGTRT